MGGGGSRGSPQATFQTPRSSPRMLRLRFFFLPILAQSCLGAYPGPVFCLKTHRKTVYFHRESTRFSFLPCAKVFFFCLSWPARPCSFCIFYTLSPSICCLRPNSPSAAVGPVALLAVGSASGPGEAKKKNLTWRKGFLFCLSWPRGGAHR